MYKESNIFKTLTVVFGLILLVLVVYLAFDKYSSYQADKLNSVYVEGYNRAINDSVTQMYAGTNNCGAISIYVGNSTRSLADVECINKFITEYQNQK